MRIYVAGVDVTDSVDFTGAFDDRAANLSFGPHYSGPDQALDSLHPIVRAIMRTFGVTPKQLGLRERRTGHRHRGTDAWARRKGFPKRVRP